MKRVVVTGLGIVSSIGNNKEEVKASLLEGKSGVKFSQEYCDKKFRCHVYAPIEGLDLDARIDRKNRRFMGDGVAYNFVAMKEAIEDSALQDDQISNERTGIVMGTGGGSFSNVQQTVDLFREKGPKRVGPYMVSRTMGSTNSAVLATAFKIKGVNYSISSACSTSAHCIGHGAELIQMGKQDIVFAGGGEEVHWTFTVMFDAMGALSSKYNDNPQKASRAYDADRDGFVISGGGGVLVLEELEHAKKRGAKIYGELVGYGATSDGYDMVAPSGEGAVRCMKLAMQGLEQPIDYINTHGTSTPAGDITELGGVKKVFGDNIPVITSTKSLSGHALGAAGVNEAVYSLIMMENDFIAASANIENLDEGAKDCNILLERKDNAGLNTIMSNSFGFGGTNASLVFSRYKS